MNTMFSDFSAFQTRAVKLGRNAENCAHICSGMVFTSAQRTSVGRHRSSCWKCGTFKAIVHSDENDVINNAPSYSTLTVIHLQNSNEDIFDEIW